LNARLHAVSDAGGRPLRVFVTAGQVSGCTGGATPLSSPPAAEGVMAGLGYDFGRFPEALKDKGIRPCIPGRKPRGKPARRKGRRCKRRNRIEIMFGRSKHRPRIAIRHDR
jgi:transposase